MLYLKAYKNNSFVFSAWLEGPLDADEQLSQEVLERSWTHGGAMPEAFSLSHIHYPTLESKDLTLEVS